MTDVAVTAANYVTGEKVHSRNGDRVTAADSPPLSTSQSRNALAVAERPLDALMAQMSAGVDPAVRERRRLVADARRLCERCAKCGRSVRPDEHVTNLRLSMGYNIMGSSSYWLAPVCDGCAPTRPGAWSYDAACPGCQRPVTRYISSTPSDPWAPEKPCYCSTRCIERVQSRRRSVARAARRVRECVVCETEFTPKRSDGRYCTNACRQDAYRMRKRGAA